jgi:hypothetical protein
VSELRYRQNTERDDLQENECTIAPVGGGLAMMVYCFRRKDGKLERRTLPVRPNGDAGDAEHSWGLRRSVPAAPGRWQIAPSIKCMERVRDLTDPKKDIDVEVWHETPAIIDVPEGEPWQ